MAFEDTEAQRTDGCWDLNSSGLDWRKKTRAGEGWAFEALNILGKGPGGLMREQW